MIYGTFVCSFAVAMLVMAVIFVNGATDAPGSIAGAVASGVMRYRSAVLTCAAFNFIGMFVSSLWMPAVSETINTLIEFGDNSTVAVCACLGSIVVFACIAWFFGIPTSESHALIASLAGASAYFKGNSDIYLFVSVILKSILSCVIGCAVGMIFLLIFKSALHNGGFLSKNTRRIQYAAAALTSACHGMQDGQKFISILFVLFPVFKSGFKTTAVLVCSAVMAVGCAAGGRKIIDKIGYELTGGIGKPEAFASDVGSVICSLGSSAAGIPISTTYMKTCSLIGASSAAGGKIDKKAVSELVLVWLATYPACMILSYGLCLLGSCIIK